MQKSYKITIIMSVVSMICLLVTLSYPNSATPLSIIPIIATVTAWIFHVDYRPDFEKGHSIKGVGRFFSSNGARVICLVIAMLLLILCAIIGFTHEIIPRDNSKHFDQIVMSNQKKSSNDEYLDEISEKIDSLVISDQSKTVIHSIVNRYSNSQYVIEPKNDFAFPFLSVYLDYNYAALVVFLVIFILSLWEVVDTVLAFNSSVDNMKVQSSSFAGMVHKMVR